MPYIENGNTVYYYGESALEEITDLKSQYGQAQIFADIFQATHNSGSPFIDSEFSHNDNSVGNYGTLFDTADPTMLQQVADWTSDGWSGSATWMRIADLCNITSNPSNTPCFNCGDIGKTIARNDIQQGSTGDCWFLSSIADISMVPSLIDYIVPSDNTTNSEGVYHFRFWYQGAWVDIVVDDYIPCVVTKDQTFPIASNFYLNNGQAEFWPMMLEKAYAKLNGSYSNIASNVIMLALENLTGGFGVYIETAGGVPANSFQQVLKWFDLGCVMGAGSTTNGGDGIVGNHAYSVTGVHVVTTNDEVQHNLMRCRNPWGCTEWKGDWSDDSPLWNEVSNDQKNAIGFLVKDDGEFWIGFNDFLKYYSDIDGSFYYNSNSVNQEGSTYQFAQFNTSWSNASNTAGGWDNPWQNPVFIVEVASSNGAGALLAVGLLVQTKLTNLNMQHGNCIRLFPTGGASTFDENFYNNSNNEIFPTGQTAPPGNNSSSYSQFYNLPSGKYFIVPSALDTGFESKILVRVYNEGTEVATQVVNSG